MLRVQNIKIEPSGNKEQVLKKVCKKIGIEEKQVKSWSIFKESLDARNKGNIFFIYTVDVEVENEKAIYKKSRNKDVSIAEHFEYSLPQGKAESEKRPVIVGFGPAGMFAALTLCQLGFKPIVLERGKDVNSRSKDVEEFWKTGVLKTNSNVQFGEGGAGTFSDGKLTSRSKDLRSRKVFKEFADLDAPDEILYVRNPHIGTDKLRVVVRNLRNKIIEMGADVRFEACVTDFEISDGKLTSLIINNEERLICDDVVLSIGHSARDTFEALYLKKVSISQKPFAVGVRIEHSQQSINLAQYGGFADLKELGAAEYKLTHTTKEGRGVYTFCMCPGGYVVAASSEEGMICVNGMSYHSRNGENANSALLAQVKPEDFKSDHPLAGMYFQRELEKKAFEKGGMDYSAPAQLVGDFLQNQKTANLKEVSSTYRPKIKFCDLNEIFPRFISEALKEAIVSMGKRLKGFDSENALLTAVESRSSSPVRIERDLKTGESVNVKGLYPVGEGAGYAGGIVSAAIDGVAAAEKIFEKYKVD